MKNFVFQLVLLISIASLFSSISCTKENYSNEEVYKFTMSSPVNGIPISTHVSGIKTGLSLQGFSPEITYDVKKQNNNMYTIDINLVVDDTRTEKFIWKVDMKTKNLVPINKNAQEISK